MPQQQSYCPRPRRRRRRRKPHQRNPGPHRPVLIPTRPHHRRPHPLPSFCSPPPQRPEHPPAHPNQPRIQNLPILRGRLKNLPNHRRPNRLPPNRPPNHRRDLTLRRRRLHLRNQPIPIRDKIRSCVVGEVVGEKLMSSYYRRGSITPRQIDLWRYS